jgi:hypothetical protein
MESTIDAEVAKILADKEHNWAKVALPEGEADICLRCGRHREGLKRADDGSYQPCRGFV